MEVKATGFVEQKSMEMMLERLHVQKFIQWCLQTVPCMRSRTGKSVLTSYPTVITPYMHGGSYCFLPIRTAGNVNCQMKQ